MLEELLVQGIVSGVTTTFVDFCLGNEIERTFMFNTGNINNSITLKAKLDIEHQHATANFKFRSSIMI